MSNSIKEGIITTNLVETAIAEKTKNLHKFLQFQLNYNTRALLPAETVTEILTIPESDILPVPQMPDCVMGIYSWRGEMLWIIDLRNLLGCIESDWQLSLDPSSQFSLTRMELKEQCADRELELDSECLSLMAIAIELEGNFLGFCLHQINNILELDPRGIHRECHEIFSPEIIPFLQGYCIDSKEQILMVLNPESLFNWQS